MKKVLWTASLSNGETLYENKGNFQIIEGELSPWQRLLVYLKEKEVRITSLSLYMDDGRRWNLPSMGKRPKFRAFDEAPQPVAYKFFRKLGFDKTGPNAGIEDHFAVIEATYEDGKRLQLWVDEDTGIAWSLIA